MERPAFGVLGGKIERIKASNVNPAWLAGELRAARIIGFEDEERARNVHVASAQRLVELVRLAQGNARRDVFQTFVNILLSQKHTDWLGKELKGTPHTRTECMIIALYAVFRLACDILNSLSVIPRTLVTL